MIRIIMWTFIYMFSVNQAFAYGDFYQGSKRGWFWFEQQPKVVLKEDNKTDNQAQQKTAIEELEEFKTELEEAKAAMIMRPSIENTIRFRKYQNEMYAKADKVTINWQDAALIEPGLNIARDIPISNSGAKIKNRAQEQSDKALLKSFAGKFKLLFFYKGDCIYCSNFAEVLEVFANRYGFAVSAVTMDGKNIDKFKGVYRNDLVQRFNIEYVPSVYAYSEELGVATPVSQEFLTIDELERNAVYVASKLKERLTR